MNTNSNIIHSGIRLFETRFLCIGADDLVAAIDKLLKDIETHDFALHEELTRSRRLAYLNDGESEQKTVTVELMDAAPFIGRLYYYRPGKALFFTADGIREVSPMELNEDMHRCFENDPAVVCTIGLKKIIAAFEKHQEESEEREKQNAASLDEIGKGIKRLADENTALQTENAELKSRLRELGE